MMKLDFNNKIVFVSGAGRGIGRAIVGLFLQSGAKVVAVGKTLQSLDKLQEDYKDYKDTLFTFQLDVSDQEQCQKVICLAVEQVGSIDVLVNNAGITHDALVMRMSFEQWSSVLNVNLNGAFFCTKFVSKYMMKKRYGRIVNVSSVIGLVGNMGQANYAASKGGLISFTKSCALEFASRGILVNAIAPGFVDTDMVRDVVSAEQKELYIKSIPLKRYAQGEEIAHLVLFLSSDYASYITGQVISINGGLYM